MSKSEETVKMMFTKEMFYNDPTKALYEPGIIYDVPKSNALRWLKRGGEIVSVLKEIPKPEEPKVESILEEPKREEFEPIKREEFEPIKREEVEPIKNKTEDRGFKKQRRNN